MKRKLALWAALPAPWPCARRFPPRAERFIIRTGRLKIIVRFAPGGRVRTSSAPHHAAAGLSELLGQPDRDREPAAERPEPSAMEGCCRSLRTATPWPWGTSGSTAINPGVFTNLSINNLRDFIPVDPSGRRAGAC